jgi:hypothetical protein
MTEQMRDGLDLDAIRERTEAATEGPWSVNKGTRGAWVTTRHPEVTGVFRSLALLANGWPDDETNAEFIAHVRTDIPALLTEIQRKQTDRRLTDRRCDVLEIQRDEARAVLGAVAALADEYERDRDVCIEWLHDPTKITDEGHPARLSLMAETLNTFATRLRAVLGPVSGVALAPPTDPATAYEPTSSVSGAHFQDEGRLG